RRDSRPRLVAHGVPRARGRAGRGGRGPPRPARRADRRRQPGPGPTPERVRRAGLPRPGDGRLGLHGRSARPGPGLRRLGTSVGPDPGGPAARACRAWQRGALVNVVDVVVVALVLAFAVAGMRQGFVVSVFSFLGFLVGGLVGLVVMPLMLRNHDPS